MEFYATSELKSKNTYTDPASPLLTTSSLDPGYSPVVLSFAADRQSLSGPLVKYTQTPPRPLIGMFVCVGPEATTPTITNHQGTIRFYETDILYKDSIAPSNSFFSSASFSINQVKLPGRVKSTPQPESQSQDPRSPHKHVKPAKTIPNTSQTHWYKKKKQ